MEDLVELLERLLPAQPGADRQRQQAAVLVLERLQQAIGEIDPDAGQVRVWVVGCEPSDVYVAGPHGHGMLFADWVASLCPGRDWTIAAPQAQPWERFAARLCELLCDDEHTADQLRRTLLDALGLDLDRMRRTHLTSKLCFALAPDRPTPDLLPVQRLAELLLAEPLWDSEESLTSAFWLSVGDEGIVMKGA